VTSGSARTTLGTAIYGSVENLIEIEVMGTPLADRLSDDQISQILAESTGIFAKFLTPAGELQMPIRAHLVMGRNSRRQLISPEPVEGHPAKVGITRSRIGPIA
jgi:hypothetical protein